MEPAWNANAPGSTTTHCSVCCAKAASRPVVAVAGSCATMNHRRWLRCECPWPTHSNRTLRAICFDRLAARPAAARPWRERFVPAFAQRAFERRSRKRLPHPIWRHHAGGAVAAPGGSLRRCASISTARCARSILAVHGTSWTSAGSTSSVPSPEILVRLERTGRCGAPDCRHAAPEDRGGRQSTGAGVACRSQERAEHIMLMDLRRNDVGRVAKTGSVRVTDHRALLA